MKHEFIKEVCPFSGEYVEIDRGIHALILSLWDKGIETRGSCENLVGKGNMWIDFPSPEIAAKFLEIACPPYDVEMHSRMMGGIDSGKDCWLSSCSHQNEAWGFEKKETGGYRLTVDESKWKWVFHVAIKFPVEDYSYILEKFAA
jgi:hypothetical protein